MKETQIKLTGELPKLKNPIFIEGLPGVGNVGRIAVGYLSEELGAKKFAELLSPHFMPFVLIHQNASVHVLKNEFYYWQAKKKNQRDLVFLIGDMQSADAIGHYDVVDTTLDFIEKLGVKEIFTTAGLSIQKETKKPKVIGVVNDPDLVKKYKGFGIDFDAGSKVGTIIGASGLFLGLGKYREMVGICLLGETSGLPEIPDPKSAEEVLNVLIKMLNVKINMSELEQKIKEMESFMRKVKKVQDRALSQMLVQEMGGSPKGDKKDLKYIG